MRKPSGIQSPGNFGVLSKKLTKISPPEAARKKREILSTNKTKRKVTKKIYKNHPLRHERNLPKEKKMESLSSTHNENNNNNKKRK